MGPNLENELFYKLLKLFFMGVQVTFQIQIHMSDLVFELECSKDGNSNIQLEIWISSKELIGYGV